MTHRDVRVSVYGVVAGVILGAGAIAFTNASLEANVGDLADARYNAAPSADEYTRRRIDEQAIPLRNDDGINLYPTVKPESSSSSAAGNVKPAAVTPCSAVRDAIAKVQATYNRVIPRNVKNTALRQSMDWAFADAMDDYCQNEEAGMSSSSGTASSAAAPTVDNNCEKFSRRSVRYTQCVLAEQDGRTYP